MKNLLGTLVLWDFWDFWDYFVNHFHSFANSIPLINTHIS